jgi:hypothetical protein
VPNVLQPRCRSMNESFFVTTGGLTRAVSERVVEDMKARLKDPDLARLFENTFPNTLGERGGR